MRKILLSVFCFLIGHLIIAQTIIDLSGQKNYCQIEQPSEDEITIELSLSEILLDEIKTSSGEFSTLLIEGFHQSNIAGKPSLPVHKSLIEIPEIFSYSYEVINVSSEKIYLNDHTMDKVIYPAQNPVPKCEDENYNFVFEYDEKLYKTDQSFGFELINIEHLGEMRAVNLAALQLAPVRYNPVENSLLLFTHLKISIQLKSESNEIQECEQYFSPFFESSYAKVVNHSTPRELITSSPATYIIVSNPMFHDALQEFITWKTKKGFKIFEAYTDDPQVGNTSSSIKSFLEDFYNDPPLGFLPQSYVLLVGDVSQLPPFDGNAGSHVSDFYFGEYTGDLLPDCVVGRFSANTISELNAQTQKTLAYEKYQFDVPSYLDHALFVAGVDAGHHDWSNGQVEYAINYYFNEEHEITPHAFFQPYDPGWNVHDSIMYWLNHGVMFANYTAHCGVQGWSNPSFNINDIAGLEQNSRYALILGNCCSSSSFNYECFGEAVVRAPNKAALAYIGASNTTYWDEDYYFAVGFKPVDPYPVYDPEALGAFDRTFHDHDEALEDWYISQGQMVIGGNLAVTQSGSSLTHYYWEVYNILGDPSAMVYYSVPEFMVVNLPETLSLVVDQFDAQVPPFAYVAVSMDGVLKGTGMADESGIAEVEIFEMFEQTGQAEVVITGQNYEPYFGTIVIEEPQGAYVLVNEWTIDDDQGNGNGWADYGESISLNMEFTNFGEEDAVNLTASISTQDEFVSILIGEDDIQDIASGESIIVNEIFSFDLLDWIPDNHEVLFEISLTNGTDIWISWITIIIHAPDFQMTDFQFSDEGGDGFVDPGEYVDLIFSIGNTGSSDARNLALSLMCDNPLVEIIEGSFLIENITAGEELDATFEILVSNASNSGDLLIFELSGQTPENYLLETESQLVVGNAPVLILDLDLNSSSAPRIKESILSKGVGCKIETGFPEDLMVHDAIFVCLGVYPDVYELSIAQGQQLANFLNAGGRIYMEGAETWFYDAVTPVHSMFNIDPVSDGNGSLDTIQGLPGTFTQSMEFQYTGENNFIDRIDAIEPAFVLMENNYPNYAVAVAFDAGDYKTIGTSFEFGGLEAGNGQRDLLMEYILNFFELTGHDNLIAQFSVSDRFPAPGEEVAFYDASQGNAISWHWTFQSGEPSMSSEQNPMVSFPVTGDYNVSLTVDDGYYTSTYTMVNYMHVTTGTPENMNSQHFEIFPNPVYGEIFYVSFTAQNQGVLHYEVLDMTGRIMMSEKTVLSDGLENYLLEIKSEKLNSGLYLFRMSFNDDQLRVKKFMVR